MIERDSQACAVLERVLDDRYNFTAAAPSAPPVPPPSTDACWSPGSAVEAAGVSGLRSLTVQQAVDVYAGFIRSLPVDAVLERDLHAFVQKNGDLNRDGRLSRLEVYLGGARLVQASVWHDGLLDQLYKTGVAAA